MKNFKCLNMKITAYAIVYILRNHDGKVIKVFGDAATDAFEIHFYSEDINTFKKAFECLNKNWCQEIFDEFCSSNGGLTSPNLIPSVGFYQTDPDKVDRFEFGDFDLSMPSPFDFSNPAQLLKEMEKYPHEERTISLSGFATRKEK